MTTTESGPLGALRARYIEELQSMLDDDAIYQREADAIRYAIEALATTGAGPVLDSDGCHVLPNGECIGGPCMHTAPAPVAVESGWVLVPRVATITMLVAMSKALGMQPLGDGTDGDYPITGQQSTIRQCFAAMLAAAPAPQAAAQVTDDAMTKIADSLDCFWNAALGAAQTGSTHGEMNMQQVIGCIAEGVSAIANRMREHAALRPNASTGEVDRG